MTQTNYQALLLPRAIQDLASSSYAGSFIYPAVFFAIVFATEYQDQHPGLTTLCLALLITFSILRLALSYGVDRMQPIVWVRWFSGLTLLIAGTWSTYWSIVLYQDGLNTTTLLAMVAITGIASAGVGTLSPLLKLSYSLLFVMLSPMMMILLQQPDDVGKAYAVMMGSGTVFLMYVSRRMNAQYWNMQKNSYLLEERAKELTAATHAKSQFLARMSHEIRTPMNGIMGMAQLLHHGNLTSEDKKLVDTIYQSSEVLLDILNDILDLSRIEIGGMELKHSSFNIVETVSETMGVLDTQAKERQLTILTEFPKNMPNTVVGDPGRVRQVLTNLVGNAIKFSENSHIIIRLSIKTREENKAHILIQVIDAGIGIAADKKAHIFDAFIQADNSTTRQHHGTGLGLAISRQLVEMMGGKIGVDDNTGPGSTFWFEIPFTIISNRTSADSRPTALTEQSLHSELLYGARILVAEDNAVNQLLIRTILEELGCKPTIVNDGVEVVDEWKKQAYDAILMDIQMPNCNGLAATKIIRDLESNSERNTPIIAVTASALSSDRQLFLEAGLDDYLSKPYRIKELETILERWAWSNRKET